MKVLKIIVVLMAFALPATAQFRSTQQKLQPVGAAPPTATFRSTSSAMMHTGSAYASNPAIGADGTASYPAPVRPIRGPLRAPNPVSTDEDVENAGGGLGTPIGDALLPMLLMAFAFMGIKRLFKKQRSIR